MNTKILAFLLTFIVNFKICQTKTYKDYAFFTLIPTNNEQLEFLRNLEKQKYLEVSYWRRPYSLNKEVDLIVSPSDKEMFIERIQHFQIQYQEKISDIEPYFEDHLGKILDRNETATRSYSSPSYEDMNQWLLDLPKEHPSFVKLEIIGNSSENRPIYALEIKKSGPSRKVFVEGGMHGNEWFSSLFVSYLVNILVKDNSTNNKALQLLSRRFHWYIVPITNPDGFVYSRKQDRLWKKNRRNVGGGVGVDLNRNFDHSFGKFDVSINPKDDNYCGPSPFSEPETRALANYVQNNSEKLTYYFSFHSYGQKIILPCGDRIEHDGDYKEVQDAALRAAKKIRDIYDTNYKVGSFYELHGGRISGDSATWVKHKFNVPYVITFLLRDNGTFGHALPVEQIEPAFKETLAGMVEMMRARRRIRRTGWSSSCFRRGSFMIVVIGSGICWWNKWA